MHQFPHHPRLLCLFFPHHFWAQAHPPQLFLPHLSVPPLLIIVLLLSIQIQNPPLTPLPVPSVFGSHPFFVSSLATSSSTPTDTLFLSSSYSYSSLASGHYSKSYKLFLTSYLHRQHHFIFHSILFKLLYLCSK